MNLGYLKDNCTWNISAGSTQSDTQAFKISIQNTAPKNEYVYSSISTDAEDKISLSTAKHV